MTDMNKKPEVDFPGGEPPVDLDINDIVEGDGAEAAAGDVAHVHYVGVAFSSGEEFDSTWAKGGTPTTLTAPKAGDPLTAEGGWSLTGDTKNVKIVRPGKSALSCHE